MGRLSVERDSGAITGTTNGGQRATQIAAKRLHRRKTLFPKSLGGAVCLALIVSLPLLAQQVRVYQDGNTWVEETSGTLPAPRELRINTDVGSIEVRGNARGIAYVFRKRAVASSKEEAERQFQKMKLTAVSTGEQAVIDGRLLERGLTTLMAELSMQVPYNLKKVMLSTGGGAMKLSSLAATVVGKTGAGAVKLDDMAGPVVITTSGGEVTAGSLGSEATIKSGGGNVHIDNIAGAAKVSTGGGQVYIGSARGLTVENGAGSIDVRRCFGNLQATTGGGNVNVGEVSGSVRIDAGAGGVRVAGSGGNVQVSTGGGSVELFKVAQGARVETPAGAITAQFTGSPGNFTESSLHTGSGDVLVFLPEELPLTVHASSDMAPGYGIRSDVPGIRITKQSSGFGPQSMWAEGILNGGGPLLRIRTAMGHIDFRKAQ
jgi:hypothetical protein